MLIGVQKNMELIILNDGLYQLIPVTKEIMEGIVITEEIDCFDLCEILYTSQKTDRALTEIILQINYQ